MKTTQVLAVFGIVVFLAFSRGAAGDGYDALRDAEAETQADFFTNRIEERREELRRLSDPTCLVWSRRANNCFLRKRSYSVRKVIFSLNPFTIY